MPHIPLSFKYTVLTTVGSLNKVAHPEIARYLQKFFY